MICVGCFLLSAALMGYIHYIANIKLTKKESTIETGHNEYTEKA